MNFTSEDNLVVIHQDRQQSVYATCYGVHGSDDAELVAALLNKHYAGQRETVDLVWGSGVESVVVGGEGGG